MWSTEWPILGPMDVDLSGLPVMISENKLMVVRGDLISCTKTSMRVGRSIVNFTKYISYLFITVVLMSIVILWIN